jgi:hypothetical protein
MFCVISHLSQLFPTCNNLSICNRQDFASALETDDNRPAKNSPDTFKISVSSLFTELYAM